MTMTDYRQLRNRQGLVSRVFPPAFPFLLLAAGAVERHAVALLPDSRFPRRHRKLQRLWRDTVEQLRATGPEGLSAEERQYFAEDLDDAFESIGDAVIAWSGTEVCAIPLGGAGELVELKGSALWADGEVELTAMLDARLIDDPEKVRRAWKLGEPVAHLSWDGGVGGLAGGTCVYRTAGGFWADWSAETGDVYGPYGDLAEALSAAGLSEGGKGLTFEVEVEPALAGDAAVIDALFALARDAVGVWFNGVPLSLDDRGLLRPLDDSDKPLPFVP